RQIGHGHRLRTALLQMGIGTGIHEVDYSILVTRSGPCTPDPNRWRPATHHNRLVRQPDPAWPHPPESGAWFYSGERTERKPPPHRPCNRLAAHVRPIARAGVPAVSTHSPARAGKSRNPAPAPAKPGGHTDHDITPVPPRSASNRQTRDPCRT